MITAADYAWQDDWQEIYTVTFVKGVDEKEVLRRYGVTEPGEVAYDDLYEPDDESSTVVAARVGEWVLVLEINGWATIDDEFFAALSAGGEAVTVLRHDFSSSGHFAHAVDGELRTRFDPNDPFDRKGAVPDALNDALRDLGLDPDDEDAEWDDGTAEALALASRVTGVVFTAGLFEGSLYGGILER
ncbi:DUF6461 domain-containing protein [Herbidospora mongoliensis]|uniref:DUF6461 domain-containing protein n=1 Tax=Herbidospora mongoliensis TaxID=688067 RepID=UPI00082EE205|nr:DUF6461 domain-containing protein [Herbidospora mongoliensis]